MLGTLNSGGGMEKSPNRWEIQGFYSRLYVTVGCINLCFRVFWRLKYKFKSSILIQQMLLKLGWWGCTPACYRFLFISFIQQDQLWFFSVNVWKQTRFSFVFYVSASWNVFHTGTVSNKMYELNIR